MNGKISASKSAGRQRECFSKRHSLFYVASSSPSAPSFMVTMPLGGSLKAITRQINYKYRLVSRGMSWSSDDSPPRHHRTGALIVNYVYGLPIDTIQYSVGW